MGANAVTTVYDFTAGQVLTAAQMDNVNCGIPVFATTVTRDAAFGGTGEKTLAEGQMAYIEATDTTQYYNGTSWVSLDGLNLIKTQTIGTTVSSVEVTGAFNATYENYLITVNGGVASTSVDLKLSLGATATSYYGFLIFGAPNSSTVSGQNVSNGTSFPYVGAGTTSQLSANIVLQSPFLTDETICISQGVRNLPAGNACYWFNGFLDNTTSYTAFTISPNTGTLTGGTIRVYGYASS